MFTLKPLNLTVNKHLEKFSKTVNCLGQGFISLLYVLKAHFWSH